MKPWNLWDLKTISNMHTVPHSSGFLYELKVFRLQFHMSHQSRGILIGFGSFKQFQPARPTAVGKLVCSRAASAPSLAAVSPNRETGASRLGGLVKPNVKPRAHGATQNTMGRLNQTRGQATVEARNAALCIQLRGHLHKSSTSGLKHKRQQLSVNWGPVHIGTGSSWWFSSTSGSAPRPLQVCYLLSRLIWIISYPNGSKLHVGTSKFEDLADQRVTTEPLALMACAPMPAKPPLRAFLDAFWRISLNDGAGLLLGWGASKRTTLEKYLRKNGRDAVQPWSENWKDLQAVSNWQTFTKHKKHAQSVPGSKVMHQWLLQKLWAKCKDCKWQT